MHIQSGKFSSSVNPRVTLREVYAARATTGPTRCAIVWSETPPGTVLPDDRDNLHFMPRCQHGRGSPSSQCSRGQLRTSPPHIAELGVSRHLSLCMRIRPFVITTRPIPMNSAEQSSCEGVAHFCFVRFWMSCDHVRDSPSARPSFSLQNRGRTHGTFCPDGFLYSVDEAPLLNCCQDSARSCGPGRLLS